MRLASVRSYPSHHRSTARHGDLLCVGFFLLFAYDASAQTTRLNAQNMRPTGDVGGLTSVWSLEAPTEFTFSTSGWADVAYRPLRLSVPALDLPAESIVRWRTDLHLGFSLGLPGRSAVGINVPFITSQRGLDNQFARDTLGYDGLSSGALGDISLWGKIWLAPEQGLLPGLGVGAILSLPTGPEKQLGGEPGAVFEPFLILGRQLGMHSLHQPRLSYTYRPGSTARDQGIERISDPQRPLVSV
ncbi:MAG: hypothetical protein R3C68_07380 [Myxococcota bacterium]